MATGKKKKNFDKNLNNCLSKLIWHYIENCKDEAISMRACIWDEPSIGSHSEIKVRATDVCSTGSLLSSCRPSLAEQPPFKLLTGLAARGQIRGRFHRSENLSLERSGRFLTRDWMTSCSRGAEDDTSALDRGFCSLTCKCFLTFGPLFHEEDIHGSIGP